ncbi:NmrA family transcriptional regulator [Aspergillus venezuelensis]
MAEKWLLVLGGTGQQGGSLIRHVLNTPHLSTQYRLRAATRDPSQPRARALQAQGVQVVQADADEEASLRRAMRGASMAFSMTMPVFHDPAAREREIAQGKAIADAAVAEGVEYIIYSTLPHVSAISGGKYKHVDYFDAKAEVEAYMRGLPIKSIFYAPGWFMQNFDQHMGLRMVEGRSVLVNIVRPETNLPLIDPNADTGKFLEPVLEGPEGFVGRTLAAAQRLYTYEEVAEIMSRVLGKPVEYEVVSHEEYTRNIPDTFGERLIEMSLYVEKYGYYGPGTEEAVSRTVASTREELTTFQGYMAREHPA